MRDGLGPVRFVAATGPLLSQLVTAYPDESWPERLAAGEVVDKVGCAFSADVRVGNGTEVFFHIEPVAETPVPFPLEILHHDEGLVVVDKPHFLATIPRGQHVRETALVRLRARTGLADLVPAHRLDRMTAGVLVFIADPTLRRPYQELFSAQRVHKTYEAIAPAVDLDFPRVVRTRIVKEHGVMVARHEAGEPNSESLVDVIERSAERARYRLEPKTGKTHQLRLHMASLGAPIVNDNYYPEYRPHRDATFDKPLQLLARAIEFNDPVTGERRRFESCRTLQDRYINHQVGPPGSVASRST
ncbi:pseudouridine synthase [Smaragdicoccus niigatensis]|uniref:pseudouridine synthase n=1 Tax=Smaragdicoccus niigatensis TaxID=359359 RepID=UPI0003AB47CD|nr:pseudouridine synthase [Smaragdicoccus niigatensis]